MLKLLIFASFFQTILRNSSVGKSAQLCRGWKREFKSRFPLQWDARMVESVDTRDLKSLGHCGCAGSSPASSTLRDKSSFWRFVSFFIPLQIVGNNI